MTTTFTVERPEPQMPIAESAFHTWTLGDGRLWTEFYREPDGYLLRFPDHADFRMSADGTSVKCTPAPNGTHSDIEHLYWNQVLPLALSRRHKMVFHASAIALGESAVCFVACSGRGKSTLAGSFALNGSGLLTDDGLLVEESNTEFYATPGHPSIRLLADSEKALIPGVVKKMPALSYTSKSRILAGDPVQFCTQPLPLKQAYFLGEGIARGLELRRLTKTDAVVEWVKHSFLIDIDDRTLLASQFDQLSKLVDAVPCYHLDYPRGYEELSVVRKEIARAATTPLSE